MLKIGSHVNLSGDEAFLGSVKEALSYEANTFMVYTGAPQNTIRKPIDKLRIPEAQQLIQESGLNINDLVVHAPYIMNIANPDDSKYQFAVDFLTEEIKRTEALGINQIVLHPGAHVGQGVSYGIKRIIKGLNEVLRNTKGSKVRIALETMAGKGTEIGRNFPELAEIIMGITDNERITVCFDTCHTHDAGYNIVSDFDGVMNEFDKIIGKSRISVFHINDSKNPQGAQKDRHANIGFGYIGFDVLNYIVHHPDFPEIPRILETPYVKVGNKEFPPYKEEIYNFRKQEWEKIGILVHL
ncbi:MAG: deoxyribonuclease IV [Bacilli bacterium]|nr:deoxyribonuclease IV [Bacilli bacterium]